MPQPARFESFSGTLKPRRPAPHRRDFGREYNRGQIVDPDQAPAPDHNEPQNPQKHAGFENQRATRQTQATPEFPQPRGRGTAGTAVVRVFAPQNANCVPETGIHDHSIPAASRKNRTLTRSG